MKIKKTFKNMETLINWYILVNDNIICGDVKRDKCYNFINTKINSIKFRDDCIIFNNRFSTNEEDMDRFFKTSERYSKQINYIEKTCEKT